MDLPAAQDGSYAWQNTWLLLTRLKELHHSGAAGRTEKVDGSDKHLQRDAVCFHGRDDAHLQSDQGLSGCRNHLAVKLCLQVAGKAHRA